MRTTRSTPAAPRTRFFVGFGIAIGLLVLTGFSQTFFLPLARGTLVRPWFVYVHGVLFFLWTALLIAQSLLVLRKKMKWHRYFGRIGAGLIPLMAGSGVVVATWATRRDIAAGGAASAVPFYFGALMDMFLFASLAAAALLMRKHPASHKRLILFATLAILGAAVGRINVIGSAANYVTVLLLLSVAAFDILTSRRIHRSTALGGTWLLLGIFTETWIGETTTWMSVASNLLRI